MQHAGMPLTTTDVITAWISTAGILGLRQRGKREIICRSFPSHILLPRAFCLR
ncbi:hypothetical protein BDA96_02G105100 [Sorghum bicolor]|uniref:Uncharacterized protein n=1 Tax=Sorghum bicolor TaxID=4558 RepID=A0A921RLN0_SORBI|nr:hypothetical protein BDA96_02G105000 [Sorghum bicolor]KAG0542448.1 hypothetical protein BDA96_02G105100 [Sorghum bicolor]